jgi:hypothetical protein
MGIALDTWVNIDGDCPMGAEIARSEVQIELGHGTGSLHLVMTEQALANLVETAGTALTTLRAAEGIPPNTIQSNSIPGAAIPGAGISEAGISVEGTPSEAIRVGAVANDVISDGTISGDVISGGVPGR